MRAPLKSLSLRTLLRPQEGKKQLLCTTSANIHSTLCFCIKAAAAVPLHAFLCNGDWFGGFIHAITPLPALWKEIAHPQLTALCLDSPLRRKFPTGNEKLVYIKSWFFPTAAARRILMNTREGRFVSWSAGAFDVWRKKTHTWVCARRSWNKSARCNDIFPSLYVQKRCLIYAAESWCKNTFEMSKNGTCL